jgi:hypothetical protein
MRVRVSLCKGLGIQDGNILMTGKPCVAVARPVA